MTATLSRPRRVVVVGGGAFGVTIGYRLVRRGFAVTLVEQDAAACHASAFNAGNLNPLLLTPPALVPLALASFQLHRELQSALVADGVPPYRIEPVRRVLLAFDSGECSALEPVARAIGEVPGFPTRWLDRDALSSTVPGVTEEVVGGLLLEGNASIDGREFLDRVLDAAVARGLVVVRDRVLDLAGRAGQVDRVATEGGTIDCDAAVLATGPWTGWIRDRLGIELGVRPIRGQLLRLRPRVPPACDLTRGEIALYRRRGGEIWVGGTIEHSGFDVAVTPRDGESLLHGAVRLWPALAGADVLEHGAALRPVGPGPVPIAARAPGWRNLYIANGGGMKGMLLSVGVAKTIEDLLAAEAADAEVSEP